ncbi:rhodanese-related sulfurtransferase [Roseivirga ehrenbergii]|uniref:NADH oxidase n=1 Tax=Roseivirga ehrenbergii (strain DSM 102268 / JCM 13514 / KCTC 12282 / NCIMB 14502 / KMM 6017) TaxID=279360 RepID=A0A150X8B0_ROSEK|nr:rhodanese-like domain-containing protein [Roseivirga ehrenbergii]KYG74977.1 NADH oxidase [Roseivirga ehrenbergii]TCL13674.1 rhodanese-related sulfurtransferase [Roseivirga ehrenbergii]
MADITVKELKEIMLNGEVKNFIDVREEWEYDEDNLGAKLIPLGDIPHRVAEIEDLKESELIIHCKSGARAGRAQKYLISRGFTNVRNLVGGIEAFRADQD